MGLVVWVVSTPLAVVNALFIWLLYRFNIDRKPMTTVKACLLECMLVFAVFIFCAWGQDYLAVPSFYLVKKWIGTCIKKA